MNNLFPVHLRWQKLFSSNIIWGLLVFGFLLFLNRNVLDNPPYWDDIIGLHSQAVWLARNDFNLFNLWFRENTFLNGGAKIYPLGIMPFLYGIGYKLLSPVNVHIAGHLFNMVCLSGAFVVFMLIVRRYVSCPVAVLGGLLALTEPIMFGISAGLGQEAPLLLLALISICFFMNGRYNLGYGLGVVAYFIKDTAIILMLAYLCFWIVMTLISFLRGDGKWRKRCFEPIKLAGFFAVIYVLMKYFTNNMIVTAFGVSLLDLSVRFAGHIVYFYPFIFISYALALGLFCLNFWQRQSKRRLMFSGFLLIFITGFYFSCFFYFVPIARYSAFILFPLSLLLLLNIRGRWGLWLMVVLVLLQLWCAAGRYYLPLPEETGRTGADLERSREYLIDLEGNRDICRFLEEQHFAEPIVVKWPFVHMLSIPEFGYVKRPLPNIYCVGVVPKMCPVKSATEGISNPQAAVFVYVPHCYRFAPNLRPAAGDLIIYRNADLPGTIYLYRRNFSVPNSR